MPFCEHLSIISGPTFSRAALSSSDPTNKRNSAREGIIFLDN